MKAKAMRADGMPIEAPGCGGKAALFLAGLVVLVWRMLR
jgi:hypothetical protein